MAFLVLKYSITALIIVIVSEVAKASDKLGALIISLPIMSILTLFWIYFDGRTIQKASNHAYYTFWYVIPTLPMFYFFPLLAEHFGFWWAIFSCCILTIAIFFPYAYILRNFGINLFP